MEVNTTLKTPKLNQFNLSKDLVDGSKILNKLFISAPPFFLYVYLKPCYYHFYNYQSRLTSDGLCRKLHVQGYILYPNRSPFHSSTEIYGAH